MIRVEGVSYHSWGRKILDGISCIIRPGELTVILGPNGAGKSTLLRLLSGEKKPAEGSVFFNGKSLSSFSPRQLALQRAVLGQQYTMSLPFTCGEVVMMGRYPHYRDQPDRRDHEIVAEALSALSAGHLTGRLFNTLSGGEQQRVQLARVLAQLEEKGEMEGKEGRIKREMKAGAEAKARFLLLDEPTANMDYLHQQLCLQRAREFCRRGQTVVMILHDLNLAAQLADRLLVLKEGRLVAEGEPRQLLDVEFIRAVYGLEAKIFYPEPGGFPVIITNLQSC